jgi:sialate O-acetylesterase
MHYYHKLMSIEIKRFLRKPFALVPVAVGTLFFSSIVLAATPNSLFSDNMVLQRDHPIPVWGTGRDGEQVTVTLAGNKASATVQNGAWRVELPPQPAGGRPLDLQIQGDNTITIHNVLMGEVWLCSGQSNMERQLGPRKGQPEIVNWQQEAATANIPDIRVFIVPTHAATAPLADGRGHWTLCSQDEVTTHISAVAFFMARALYQHLHVPIGIVQASVGGTPGEAWVSRDALASTPETATLISDFDKATAAYPQLLAEYQQKQPQLEADYEKQLQEAQQADKPLPRKPAPPQPPLPLGRHYYGMISSIIGYPIRGIAWYQGESNSKRGRQYQTILSLLIQEWRHDWGQPDLPFLVVQIAPCPANTPDVREAELRVVKSLPHTALIVTADVGDKELHPPNKRPVGERLALAAQALAYGEKIEYSGPLFDSATFADGKATVHFTHLGAALMAKDGPLRGFEVAGDDGKFQPAQAEIVGDAVEVSSSTVPNPTAVRYGWTNFPNVNLFNQDGLPASPFCSGEY